MAVHLRKVWKINDTPVPLVQDAIIINCLSWFPSNVLTCFVPATRVDDAKRFYREVGLPFPNPVPRSVTGEMTMRIPLYQVSPYFLKANVHFAGEAPKPCIFENIWQGAKLYPRVSKQSQAKEAWDHPEEQHLSSDGVTPTPAYWVWRKKLMTHPSPVRYPNGNKGAALCKCALWPKPSSNGYSSSSVSETKAEALVTTTAATATAMATAPATVATATTTAITTATTNHGSSLRGDGTDVAAIDMDVAWGSARWNSHGYIEARKRIYVGEYARWVKQTAACKMLTVLSKLGYTLELLEVDCPRSVVANLDNFLDYIDRDVPRFGHTWTLAMIIQDCLPSFSDAATSSSADEEKSDSKQSLPS